jgi:peptidoglycan/LPS O-acetylase OafA/YrhL
LNLPVRTAYCVFMIGTVFALAAVSWRYFESPLLSLKNRFTY